MSKISVSLHTLGGACSFVESYLDGCCGSLDGSSKEEQARLQIISYRCGDGLPKRPISSVL